MGAYSGILWHTLAFYGILWHTLAYSGILWHTLAYSAYSGILWHTLANSGKLFQITPVLNTGLSLSEPLQLYKGYDAISRQSLDSMCWLHGCLMGLTGHH